MNAAKFFRVYGSGHMSRTRIANTGKEWTLTSALGQQDQLADKNNFFMT